jgi:hypothetical protein
LRLGDAPEVDPVTGEFYFRFPLRDVPDALQEDLFRQVVQDQLHALLDLIELYEEDRPLRVTGYRLLSEREIRPLAGQADDGPP